VNRCGIVADTCKAKEVTLVDLSDVDLFRFAIESCFKRFYRVLGNIKRVGECVCGSQWQKSYFKIFPHYLIKKHVNCAVAAADKKCIETFFFRLFNETGGMFYRGAGF